MSMERMTTPTAEEVQEDIDINTREGLKAFSKYTEDTYSEIIERVKEDSRESAHETLLKATGLFESLKTKLDTAFSIKETDEHIDEVLADELQEYYNKLLDILDETEVVAETEADQPTLEVESVPETEVVDEEPVAVIPEIRVEETASVVPVVLVAPSPVITEAAPQVSVVEMVASKPAVEEDEESELPAQFESSFSDTKENEVVVAPAEVVDETELIIDEGEVIEKDTLTELKEKSESLITRAEAMLEKYQEITEVISSDVVLNVGQHYFKQLGLTTERARGTLKNISEHLSKNNKVTELSAEHFEDTIDEISANLDQLDKALGGFFEAVPDEIDMLSPEPKKQTSGAIEVAKEEVVEEIVPIVLVPKPELQTAVHEKNEVQAIYNSPTRPSVERIEKAFKGEWGGLVEKVLAIPRYKNFVNTTFSSPVQFDAMLRREINHIEAPSKFDTTFGFTNKSAFHELLRPMTVKEVAEFDTQPREVIRADLQERDIKYEVYLDWIDSLNSMLTVTHAHPTMTFGELFIRAELETLLQHHEAMAA